MSGFRSVLAGHKPTTPRRCDSGQALIDGTRLLLAQAVCDVEVPNGREREQLRLREAEFTSSPHFRRLASENARSGVYILGSAWLAAHRCSSLRGRRRGARNDQGHLCSAHTAGTFIQADSTTWSGNPRKSAILAHWRAGEASRTCRQIRRSARGEFYAINCR